MAEWNALERMPLHCSISFHLFIGRVNITMEVLAFHRVPDCIFVEKEAFTACERLQNRPNNFQVFNAAVDLAHGGKRLGAGRPVGTGSPLRALKSARAADRAQSSSYLRSLVGTAEDPARIALALAIDPSVDVRLRIDCALGLVPFVHPKLSYTEVNAQHLTVRADASNVLQELENRLSRFRPAEPSTDIPSVSRELMSVDGSVAYSDDATGVSVLCPQNTCDEG